MEEIHYTKAIFIASINHSILIKSVFLLLLC